MRDWGTLRSEGARWQPVDKSGGDKAVKEESGQSSPSKEPGGEKSSGSKGFRTDTQISNSKANGKERKLQRWDETEEAGDHIGSLEELTGGNGNRNGGGRSQKANKDEPWDQFRANYELFGYKSTYKADMSQYTTPLDPSKVPEHLRRKAEKLAKEIDSSGRNKASDDCQNWDCDDEEDLFSAVPREHGYNTHGDSGGYPAGGEWGWTGEAARAPAAPTSRAPDGGAGIALLGMLKQAAPAAESQGGSDYRSMVAPKVHAWWKAREIDGETLPEGEASGMVCPFSRKVFGEASQLVMHWAAALPKTAELAEGEAEAGTSCAVSTAQFRHAAGGLRWSEIVETYGLAEAFSVENPKEGSVWAQVVARVVKATAEEKGPLVERLAIDFVTEVLSIKCWRRDQKVEHRELQESIAAALAMHLIENAGGRTWQYPADE